MADQAPSDFTPQQARLWRSAKVLHDLGATLIRVHRNSKQPTDNGWPTQGRQSFETIELWIRQGNNVGMVCGASSDRLVVDVDTYKGAAAPDGVPKTQETTTPRGGRHLHFKAVEGIKNSAGALAVGVDVRSDGGQVLIPGSCIDGNEYAWASGSAPWEVDLADLPLPVIEKLRSTTRTNPKPRKSKRDAWAAKALAAETAKVSAATEGTRNDTLNTAAFNLGQICAGGSLSEHDAADALLNAATTAGLPESEAIATIESGMSAGAKEPRAPKNEVPIGEDGLPKHDPLTDTGNAERLVKRAAGDLRFCFAWGKWLHWNGRRWATDTTGAAMRLSKAVARDFLRMAAECSDRDVCKAYTEWGLKSEKVERRKAMVELAKSEPGIAITPEDFDRHPNLLACANGTIDLVTGQLRPHRREDYLTKLCPTKYLPEAKCPTWRGFLERVLPDDDTREYVHRLAGYGVTGDVSEQIVAFFIGDGANGKSTFARVIQDTLSKNFAIQIASDLLIAKGQRNHPTEIADLFGVRMAFGVETESGQRLDEPLIKQLTGGDRVRARRMREDFWEFDPTHKIFLLSNHMPQVTGREHAIWRRLHFVHFEVIIPPKERDRGLLKKLLAEREGVLAWLVEGCLKWRARGLEAPESVQLTGPVAAQLVTPEDEFITTRILRKPGARSGAKETYQAYCAWCAAHEHKPATQQDFGLQMGRRGIGRKKSGGLKVYLDIELVGDDQGREGQQSGLIPYIPLAKGGMQEVVPVVPSGPQLGPWDAQDGVRSQTPCFACDGTTMWRRTADTELFCMRCAPPAPVIFSRRSGHQVIDTATGEVVRDA